MIPKRILKCIAQIIAAVATFLSVIMLHWLLWRFIIPSSSGVSAQTTSFFRAPSRRGFFNGTIGFLATCRLPSSTASSFPAIYSADDLSRD